MQLFSRYLTLIFKAKMSNDEELVVVEEYDQLFKYYNDLQKPDFFENNDFLENMSETQKKKIAKREQYRKEGTFVEEPYSTDEEGEEDPECNLTRF